MYMTEVLRLNKEQWDDVLLRFSDANLYQTWGYGATQWGEHQLDHLILKDGQQIVAAAQVRIVTVPVLKYVGIAYVNSGPLWTIRDCKPDLGIYKQILKSLSLEYIEKRKLLLRIVPIGFDQKQLGLNLLIEQEGYRWRGSPYRTFLLDLSPPLDVLRSNMKSNWRNHLKRSEKNELVTHVGSSMELFDVFKKLYKEMVNRKGFSTNYNINDFCRIQERLPDEMKMLVVICYFHGEPVAGVVSWVVGDTGCTIFRASSEQGNKLKAAYFVYWELVKLLKKHGCLWFDQGGIDSVVNPGVYKFKAGLGGGEVSSIGLFELNRNPINRVIIDGSERLYRWWGGTLKSFRQNVTPKKKVCANKKIKVLHLIAPTSIGGAENVLFGLMESIDKQLFDSIVVFFAKKSDGQTQFHRNCLELHETFEVVELKNAYDMGQLLRLFSIFNFHRPNIVHCHGYKTNLFGIIFAKLFKVKTISTVHGLYPHGKGHYLIRLGVYCLTRFDAVIAVSGKIKGQLTARGILEGKIHTLKNVPVPIKPDPERCLNDFHPDLMDKNEGKIKIGFVGRLEQVKGCHVLIDAAVILIKKYPDIFFLIFGDGSQRKLLEEKVNLLGLKEHIHLFGFEKDVDRVYDLLDVFVLPSLTEGIPLSLLEAMSKGVPVVASDVGGVPEVIRNLENGVLVEPNSVMSLVEGIEKIINDQQFSDELESKAKKTIEEEFNVISWIGKIQKIYENMYP